MPDTLNVQPVTYSKGCDRFETHKSLVQVYIMGLDRLEYCKLLARCGQFEEKITSRSSYSLNIEIQCGGNYLG